MSMFIIPLVIVILIGLFFVGTYNGLVTIQNRVREALSDIGVQQKRRWDLIPNLIEAVKGYASHEKEIFQRVTEARSNAINAGQSGNLQKMQAAESTLSGALRTVFAVAENYPDLKANVNFLDLQRELADTENKVQAARRFYNGNVRDYNILTESFPSNVIAGVFSFTKKDLFDLADNDAAQQPIKVAF